MKRLSFLIASMLVLAFGVQLSFAQQGLILPRISQRASVMQRIGQTDITITYHRPGVQGRKIWGGLVPYGKVWRAGANENTTIAFSGPVKIAGKTIEAGTYGFHIIPEKDQWTLILSSQYKAWGSFSYDEKEDVLRFTVKPEKSNFTERLQYTFENPTDNSVRIALQWEKIRVSFDAQVDVNAVVLSGIRDQLRGLPRFSWQGWNQAAAYCLNHDVNLEEGLAWANRSISMNKNFTNLRTKAGILEKQGNEKAAQKTHETAWTIATENEVNILGYQTMNRGQIEKAINIFKRNVQNHPDSWNVYDSLGEAFANNGQKDLAVKNYNIALTKVKDEKQKKRIQDTLSKLQVD